MVNFSHYAFYMLQWISWDGVRTHGRRHLKLKRQHQQRLFLITSKRKGLSSVETLYWVQLYGVKGDRTVGLCWHDFRGPSVSTHLSTSQLCQRKGANSTLRCICTHTITPALPRWMSDSRKSWVIYWVNDGWESYGHNCGADPSSLLLCVWLTFTCVLPPLLA